MNKLPICSILHIDIMYLLLLCIYHLTIKFTIFKDHFVAMTSAVRADRQNRFTRLNGGSVRALFSVFKSIDDATETDKIAKPEFADTSPTCLAGFNIGCGRVGFLFCVYFGLICWCLPQAQKWSSMRFPWHRRIVIRLGLFLFLIMVRNSKTRYEFGWYCPQYMW